METLEAAQQTVDQLSDETLFAELWCLGDLSWKLHEDQLRVYQQYREWEARKPRSSKGLFDRVFVFDCSRRWGKDFLCLLIKLEDCIRHPGSIQLYGTAYQKDIADIVRPLIEFITADAPDELRPHYQGSTEGETAGYFFPKEGPAKGSRIKLVGVDMHPDALRGRGLDGGVISEAAFITKLREAIQEIIYPQFQGRRHARLILPSTPPKDPLAEYDEIFVPDAKARGAYVFRTILDNPLLTEEERNEFIRAAGGRGAPSCEREYFGVRVREETKVVVPDFDPEKHVRSLPVPQYADCYVALDPGMRDLCAILWGFWDFENARLVIQRDWAERNASTATVAAVIKQYEAELWTARKDAEGRPSPLLRWSNGQFKPNPYLRVSDTDLRLLHDLHNEHGLSVYPVSKTTGAKTELKEAGLGSVRTAIGNGQVIIDPRCEKLISHVYGAKWNRHRTDYERSEVYGHYDLLDCLVYLWRSVVRNHNAAPPAHHGVPHDQIPVSYQRPPMDAATALKTVLGSNQKQQPWQRAKSTWQRRSSRR